MGFKKVYKSLQEIFPQIDARALRAVAIEHSEDADAAVEAVLEEVIPFFVERSRPSSPLTQSNPVGESSEGDSLSSGESSEVFRTQTVDGSSLNALGSAELQNGSNVNTGNQQFFKDAGDEHNVSTHDTHNGNHERDDNTTLLTISERTHEYKIEVSADVYSLGEPVVLADKNGANAPQNETSGLPEIEETISGNNGPESSLKIPSSDSIPCQTLGTLRDVDVGVNQNMDLIQEKEEIFRNLENDNGTSSNEENDLGNTCADGNYFFNRTASITSHGPTINPLESSAQLVEVPDMLESNLEKLGVSVSSDTASKKETMSSVIGAEDESTINATMYQSSQIRIIDVLEELIARAINNKKTMLSAMESVVNLMREVELKEEAAEKAKEEAAKGGANILDKVEELKQMLQDAEEANVMHAGEVYGEKAILATELRELQTRVLSLSSERDKSLGVLDEMHQTLEERSAAAENEITSAKQEKLKKEETAQKSLADLELTMEKMVQESKILKQQAEDNNKLREFLMDRSRVVDLLQGEIAVICQDVRLLKDKFNERVPFSKLLYSSQTSFILASSSSSSKNLVPNQGPLPYRDDSLQMQKDHKQNSEEEVARDDRNALLDDGWDFFESLEVNA